VQNHTEFMQKALSLARLAMKSKEVPVGCIVVQGEKIIGEGHNRPISDKDPTGHAEIIAIRQAALSVNNYRLNETSIYVTLEPCIMCLGAILNARIKTLFFGADDSKSGACGGALEIHRNKNVNHHLSVHGGLCADESIALLQEFFSKLRG